MSVRGVRLAHHSLPIRTNKFRMLAHLFADMFNETWMKMVQQKQLLILC